MLFCILWYPTGSTSPYRQTVCVAEKGNGLLTFSLQLTLGQSLSEENWKNFSKKRRQRNPRTVEKTKWLQFLFSS